GARRARGRGARAGRVRELHETVDVTDLEPDLDLGTDSEHVALPEVELVRDLDGAATRLLDLGHAVGDRALRETDRDALDRTPHGGRPVTSETDGGRATSGVDAVGVVDALAEELRDSRSVLDRVEQQRATRGVDLPEQQGLGLAGQRPTVEGAASVGDLRVSLDEARVGALLNVIRLRRQRDRGRGTELSEVRAGGTRGREHGRVELLRQRAGQTTDALVVERVEVATELVRERDDHGQRVGRDVLAVERGTGDRLLSGLRQPLGLRVTGDDRDGDARAGELDAAGELLNSRRLLHVRPDLRRDFLGENDTARSAVDVDSSHDWPTFLGSLKNRGHRIGECLRWGP